jgi:hypothetical protein
LNEQKIMPPNLYRNTNSGNAVQAAKSLKVWTNIVISAILKNRIYCGDMVQGRTMTKRHVTTWRDPSDWVVTENTHEPIVTRELFDTVQGKRRKVSHSSASSDNAFAGKLYCGHCGYAIHYEKRRRKDNAYYSCVTRKIHGRNECYQVSINGIDLKTQVLEVLRKQVAVLAEQNGDNAAPKTPMPIGSDEIAQVRNELARASGFLKGLYESLVGGDITNGEYAEMKQGYEAKISALKARERLLRAESRERHMRESAFQSASDTLGAINTISDLTAEVVDALIDRILLFRDKHIEVAFKFSDGLAATEGMGNE